MKCLNILESYQKSFYFLSYSLYTSFLFITQNIMADDECVCYKHKKTGNVLFNCSESKGQDDDYATIGCKTNSVTGKEKRIDIKEVEYTKDENWDKEWEKIESGKTDCDPCEGR